MASIDKLGRVVIPQAEREAAGLKPGTDVTFHRKGGTITLQAVSTDGSCPCCGTKVAAKAKPARKAVARKVPAKRATKAKAAPKRKVAAKR